MLQYPGMPLQYSGILQHFPLLRQQYLAAHPLFSLPAADNNPDRYGADTDFCDELSDQLFSTDNDTVRRVIRLFLEYGLFDILDMFSDKR